METWAETLTYIRKLLIMSTRKCYRSICNHPFTVCMLCFLLLLYRSFPLAFSFLVSASPVLVCTAVLLGTLLSFGQPNIPDIETEEKVSHDVSSFQTEFLEGSTVFAEREEGFAVKRYTEERGFEEASLDGDKVAKVEGEDFPLSFVPLHLDDINSREIGLENPVNEVVERGFRTLEFENRRAVDEENPKIGGVLSDGEAIENDYVFVQKDIDETGDVKSEKSPEVSADSSHGDHLEFLPDSGKQQKDGDDDEDDSFDSGSDGEESSSPDASMADILPVLDELHPLLDSDAPKPTETLLDVSYAASEHSQGSSDRSVESDEDTESQDETKEVEGGVDERKEERPKVKDDDSKSAIKWTEDDQKNLMDLGSSELERNQRLEHLIARRVARKTLRLLTEKNLIDLDSADLPFNVAPISTGRRNPFDFPDTSYSDMGLPPIPGSAPSIMQPRRNPFDLPYEPNEEKPDLKGDSFQQEFMNLNQKEPIFKRHESFSVGPSGFGVHRYEKEDINWKPIFVPERFTMEGTSYLPFQRQSSEMSDSKMSSVPETESVTSAEQDEQKLNDQDLSPEPEMNSNIDLALDQLEHTSQSSGDSDVDGHHLVERNIRQKEVEITLGGVENPSELDLNSETKENIIPVELSPAEAHLTPGLVSEESSGTSNQSSRSEVIDGPLNDRKENIGSSELVDHHLQDSGVSTERSVREVEFMFLSGEIENNQPKEPVFDSSPPAIERFLSFASVSSDTLAEVTEKGLPTASTRVIASVGDTESERRDNNNEGDKIQSSGNGEHISSELRGDNNLNLSSESANHHMPMEEKSLSGLHNLSTSDELVVSQSVDELKKDENLPSTFQEKSQATCVTHDGNAQEDHEVVHKPVPPLSSLTHDSGATFFDSAEFRTPMGDSSTIGGFGSKDHHEFQVAEESVKDEIKGIDEQILSELDTVGDFSVRDADFSSDSESKLDNTNNKSTESGPPPENLKAAEGKLDLPVLEARSREDIELAFKQLREGVDVNEVIIPSSIKDQLFVEEWEDGSINKSDLHVVDARSIDDIIVALKQISENKFGDQPKLDLSLDSDGVEAKEAGSSNLLVSNGAGSGFEMNRTIVDKTEETSRGGGSSKLNESSEAGVEMNRTSVDKTEEISKEGVSSKLIESSGGESGVEMSRTPVEKTEEISKGQSSKLIPSICAGSGVEMIRTPVDKIEEICEKTSGSIDSDSCHTGRSVEFISEPIEEETHPISVGSGVAPDTRKAESVLDLPVLEARSHEDIDMAFRQLHEGVDVKEVILPSSLKDQHILGESEDDLKNQSDFHVIEARSIDDISVALKQIDESKMGEEPKHNSKNASDGVEAKGGPLQLPESSGTGTGVEMNRTPADKSEEAYKEISVNDDLSSSITSGENAKSESK